VFGASPIFVRFHAIVADRVLRAAAVKGVLGFGVAVGWVTERVGTRAGLPANHWVYVSEIVEGMPIFLFCYTDRSLRGLWRAASDGGKDINPQGWLRPDDLRRNPSARTKYPAQVRDCSHGGTLHRFRAGFASSPLQTDMGRGGGHAGAGRACQVVSAAHGGGVQADHQRVLPQVRYRLRARLNPLSLSRLERPTRIDITLRWMCVVVSHRLQTRFAAPDGVRAGGTTWQRWALPFRADGGGGVPALRADATQGGRQRAVL